MIFTLNLHTQEAHASVRALLQAWRVPRTWQHELRVTHGIRFDGQYRYFNEPVAPGEAVTLKFASEITEDYTQADHPVTIIHEEEQFLIVDKPAGLKMHPNLPGESGTLMNRVATHCAPNPIFITHRLDQATSGLVLIAKNPLSRALINRQLSDKSMRKIYQAIVEPGVPEAGTISFPIGHDPADQRKRMVRSDGLPAVTHYRLLAHEPAGDRVELALETGRTHQLRVHLAAMGHPIVGDPLYADVAVGAGRMLLHATELTLKRPFTGESLSFSSPTPF